MKSNKRHRPSKKAPFFDSDVIATGVASALSRDVRTCSKLLYAVTPSALLKEFASYQDESTLKKYLRPDRDTSELEGKAFADFLKVNESIGKTNAALKALSELTVDFSDPTLEKIRIARNCISSILGDITTDEWYNRCKNSGGVSLGVPFMDTSNEQKFKCPITVTQRVKPLFDDYLNFDSSLKLAIQDLNGLPAFADDRYDVVEASRATTVPKTDSKRRMIAIEPTGNMYFQQGLMSLMYGRMRSFGLNVRRLPSSHTSLAWQSSITGSLSTIDWSSASDTVAYELVRLLMPTRWFMRLDMVRCTHMTVDGQKVPLNMFSTMGNATTFPIETLIFYALAVAHIDYENRLPGWKNSRLVCLHRGRYKDVSVFGDDCILPTPYADSYVDLMESVGFIPNRDKTCIGGPGFRESCGGDYLLGYNVRPFFLRGPTALKKSCLEPWLYIIANSILKKSIQLFGTTNYIYQSQALRFILSQFSEYNLKIKVVPGDFPDDSGLKIGADRCRLSSNFPELKFSPTRCSKHGTVSFLFCKFVYKQSASKHDPTQLALALKRAVDRQATDFLAAKQAFRYRVRSKGGYVVSKGYSPFWTL